MADSIGGFGMMDYTQVQRLIQVTDEMNKKMSQIATDLALLQRDVNDLRQRFAELEDRTPLTPAVSWQAWLLAGVALLAAASVLASLVGGR